VTAMGVIFFLSMSMAQAQDPRPLISDAVQFRETREQFNKSYQAIKTADQLEKFLNTESDAVTYKNLPPDLQYYVIQMSLIRPFRGFAQKVSDLLRRAPGSPKPELLDSSRELSGVLGMTKTPWSLGSLWIHAPDPDYKKPWTRMSDLQNMLAGSLKPTWLVAKDRLQALATSGVSFLFDSSYIIAGAPAPTVVGPAEVLANIYALNMALHDINLFCSYNREEYFKVHAELHHKPMITARARGKILLGHPDYLTIRKDGQASDVSSRRMMMEAFDDLTSASVALTLSWETLKNKAENQYTLLRPSRWISRVELKQPLVDNLKKLTVKLSDYVTVQVVPATDNVSVSLFNFYQVVPDLKSLLPSRYTSSGKALGWNLAAYSGFVNVEEQNDAYIDKVTRVMSQSLGGLYDSSPLFQVIE